MDPRDAEWQPRSRWSLSTVESAATYSAADNSSASIPDARRSSSATIRPDSGDSASSAAVPRSRWSISTIESGPTATTSLLDASQLPTAAPPPRPNTRPLSRWSLSTASVQSSGVDEDYGGTFTTHLSVPYDDEELDLSARLVGDGVSLNTDPSIFGDDYNDGEYGENANDVSLTAEHNDGDYDYNDDYDQKTVKSRPGSPAWSEATECETGVATPVVVSKPVPMPEVRTLNLPSSNVPLSAPPSPRQSSSQIDPVPSLPAPTSFSRPASPWHDSSGSLSGWTSRASLEPTMSRASVERPSTGDTGRFSPRSGGKASFNSERFSDRVSDRFSDPSSERSSGRNPPSSDRSFPNRPRLGDPPKRKDKLTIQPPRRRNTALSFPGPNEFTSRPSRSRHTAAISTSTSSSRSAPRATSPALSMSSAGGPGTTPPSAGIVLRTRLTNSPYTPLLTALSSPQPARTTLTNSPYTPLVPSTPLGDRVAGFPASAWARASTTSTSSDAGSGGRKRTGVVGTVARWLGGG